MNLSTCFLGIWRLILCLFTLIIFRFPSSYACTFSLWIWRFLLNFCYHLNAEIALEFTVFVWACICMHILCLFSCHPLSPSSSPPHPIRFAPANPFLYLSLTHYSDYLLLVPSLPLFPELWILLPSSSAAGFWLQISLLLSEFIPCSFFTSWSRVEVMAINKNMWIWEILNFEIITNLQKGRKYCTKNFFPLNCLRVSTDLLSINLSTLLCICYKYGPSLA